MPLILKVILLAVLIMLSAFFSGVEAAFLSIGRLKMRNMVEKNLKGAKTAKELKDNSSRLIVTLLIGNNIVNIGASAIATSAAIDIFGSTGVGIATGIMTFIVLVFGEITPKTLAMSHSDTVCRMSAGIIKAVYFALYPFVYVFEMFSNWLARATRTGREHPAVTEEEIKSYIKMGEEIGSIEKAEKEMIHNIFKLNDIEAREIMTPRINLIAFDSDSILSDVIDIMIKSGYSRIPVYRERFDCIIGVLYAKDVLKHQRAGNLGMKLRDIARPVPIIPETKKVNELLAEFQKKARHIAVVVDEYGIVSGIVTIEDILEEIVGEIYDESDILREQVIRLDRSTAKFKGEATIEDIKRMLKIYIETNGSYDTISGYVMARLGRIPEKGETVQGQKFDIIIDKVENNRISEGRIIKR